MATPIERFKNAYQNHRWNPFTDGDMAVDKEEAHLTIPGSSPFCLQLLEVPRKDTPSSVAIYNHSDGEYMTEVVTSPTQGQFRVDYPDPDGEGTGLVEFNSADNGKDITITYKATGSPIVAEILDTKISYPAGSPAENQIVIMKSGAPAWAYNPIRMFHSENVLYHPSGEDESCLLFRFKKGSNESKVFLALMGAKVHQGFYTELKPHNHGATGLSTANNGGHSHIVDSHNHGAGTLTQPTHCHLVRYGTPYDGYTNYAGGDNITGSTASVSPGTSSVSNHSHAVNGSTASTPDQPKTYPDQLKIYIDETDRTAALLAICGLDKFGDGTGTHAFIVNGTGEMDIMPFLGGGSWYTIKITEPIADRGGRVLLNMEIY